MTLKILYIIMNQEFDAVPESKQDIQLGRNLH